MILETLKYLASELNNDLKPGSIGAEAIVQLHNVARLDTDNDASNAANQHKLLLTLVNIEEERTLRNEPAYVRTGKDHIDKRNPTLHLNLYLLFSCSDEYANALGWLDKAILFFQRKKIFTAASASAGFASLFPNGVDKLILDLYTLNFEQINHLWGVLGGKYVPSVLYKLRMLPIESDLTEKAAPITEIQADSHLNT